MLKIFNKIRRALEQRIDQIFAISWKKLTKYKNTPNYDGNPRIALITVNFSTTKFLKLMLSTLIKQSHLKYIQQIIIVDNNSKDGGKNFLVKLAKKIPKVHLVENNWITTHAKGVRVGIEYLQKLENSSTQPTPENEQSNLLLIADTDIVFRNPSTLKDICDLIDTEKTVCAAELRYAKGICPQAQASFILITKSCYLDKKTTPFVNHGSPAYWMQRSVWKSGKTIANFPSNFGDYILHRGRSGIAAAKQYHPFDSNAKLAPSNRTPHYMGIKNGKKIWQEIENKYQELLKKESASKLISKLNNSLSL